MKVALFGTPVFAADILAGILEFSEIEVCLVVSQPDMPVGRKQELLHTPVKQKALENEISVFQPESLKKNKMFQEYLKSLDLDFIVVVAYGKIIPKSILDIPKYGCINIHGSILPKYRGASPVQEALKNGDGETGLTTMYMSEKMDEGNILQIAKIQVDILDTSENIFQKFTQVGPELLHKTLQRIQAGNLQSTPQNPAEATYCSKIEKTDGAISFQKQTGAEIYNLFRAYTPWPGIYSFYEGKRVVIEECHLYQYTSLQPSPAFSLSQTFSQGENNEGEVGQFLKISKNRYGVVCSDGNILELKQVKPEGKKSMDIQSFVNGNKGVLEYRFE